MPEVVIEKARRSGEERIKQKKKTKKTTEKKKVKTLTQNPL